MGRCSQADGIIAFEHLVLAATNFGFGACWQGTYLGNLEEHAKVIKGALGIPGKMQIVALTPLGYPGEEPEARPKKPLEDLVHFEKF
jgi:nitroreductase